MDITLERYHGLGNDYLVYDPNKNELELNEENVKMLCNRNMGLGADGILEGPLMEEKQMAVRIWNPNGSIAEKSGNGVRIFAKYLKDAGYVQKKHYTMLTDGGEVEITYLNEEGSRLKVSMGKLSFWSDEIPVIGDLFFSYGFMTYLCIIVAVVLSVFLFKTRYGLNLRAIGENPGTADAAGINVTKYKYLSTCIGAGLAGLGGLYFVMEYSGGTWTDNGFGDRGWLAVALVIFALWKPVNAIWGAFLFGALYILYLYIPGLGRSMQEVFKALPYVVTIIVLVFTSFRKKKEHQPPAGLGLPYFREER